MTRDLGEARAQWRETLAMIRNAPITDARKLVDEMIADLDGLFPLPAARPARRQR